MSTSLVDYVHLAASAVMELQLEPKNICKFIFLHLDDGHSPEYWFQNEQDYTLFCIGFLSCM